MIRDLNESGAIARKMRYQQILSHSPPFLFPRDSPLPRVQPNLMYSSIIHFLAARRATAERDCRGGELPYRVDDERRRKRGALSQVGSTGDGGRDGGGGSGGGMPIKYASENWI